MEGVFNFTILFFWLPMEGVAREIAHGLSMFYHHLETFFVAQNV
jgi:hypothetical protein